MTCDHACVSAPQKVTSTRGLTEQFHSAPKYDFFFTGENVTHNGTGNHEHKSRLSGDAVAPVRVWHQSAQNMGIRLGWNKSGLRIKGSDLARRVTG